MLDQFRIATLSALSLFAGACVSTPMRQIPPRMPEAGAGVLANAANGGRVQSIAVNPRDRKMAIIANQFGGMWKTYGAGSAWFRIFSLPQVYVTDLAYEPEVGTLVAAVVRDNGVQPGGGGIYVSRTDGDTWTRPATGVVPGTTPGSAYSVSPAPDERGLWYVGTNMGIAVSQDDGASWTYRNVGPTPVQSVLAFPGGSALAMDEGAVWRSDDRGASWRIVIRDDFTQFAPKDGGVGSSGNKMDRAPGKPWAFIFNQFRASPANGSGKIWFYELDSDTRTVLAIPQGRSRGPFFRITPDHLNGGDHIRAWLGVGWDGYYINRDNAAAIRALQSTATFDDWVSFIAEAGIHADMGDLGLDGDLTPAFMGSDGGIYKPRPMEKWWAIGGKSKWMSAAVPGSGLNSLQISDLHGTNFRAPDGRFTTRLHFTTQDNQLYTSADGGGTWSVGDGGEGFGLEGRTDAVNGESAQIAFISVNNNGDQFADADMTNKRIIPRVDQDGTPLDGWQNTTFVSQPSGAAESNWIRRRLSGAPVEAELHFSNNSGLNWHKFATVEFKIAGEVRTSGQVAWTPVFLGGVGNPIGLIPVATSTAPGVPSPTYDDSDVVRPAGGSLGQMFTEFDKHAVFAADPEDWRFVIAPDILANDVKMTRDGGLTWYTNAALTAEVRRGGALNLYGGKPDLMSVTYIAFDPYHSRRILVATRDSGIICSADGGRTWRTIFDSDKVQYITSLHFTPNGAVYVASYGQGLWQIQATANCPKTYNYPWDDRRPLPEPAVSTTILERTGLAPAPRGIAASGQPKLSAEWMSGETLLMLGGRGFAPGQEVVLRSPQIGKFGGRASADSAGKFSVTIAVPTDLMPGTYTIEASSGGRMLTTSDFHKPYGEDEHNKKPQ